MMVDPCHQIEYLSLKCDSDAHNDGYSYPLFTAMTKARVAVCGDHSRVGSAKHGRGRRRGVVGFYTTL